jgi:glycerophosphoryl diester phosphodiesterase
VLELKSDFTEEETARFIEIIRSYDYLDGVTFISFHYDNLVKIRNILPEQSVQFLFSKFSEEIFERVVADKMDVDVAHGELTEELIARFHNAGIVVNCWTVDNKERAEELASWGVDFITTNILE